MLCIGFPDHRHEQYLQTNQEENIGKGERERPITVDPLKAPCLVLDPRSDDPDATPGDNIKTSKREDRPSVRP